MNKRQYTKTHAALTASLTALRATTATMVENYSDVHVDQQDSYGDIVNNMHDAVTDLEAQVRLLEIVGYGNRPQVSAETAALIAANID